MTAQLQSPFAVGALVHARAREWVVLPESTDDLLVLRPLGGSEDETAGIYLPLEPVRSARFALPDPGLPGDYHSCNLLRNALRLGFRSSAGPFRSFGRLAVEPRPYQLVPLLMALKQDPVRMLIADDVGIGKTVEAGIIARELLDRGEIRRLAVLCPPPLAEQWQAELKEKFHIDAVTVLPGTAARLERNCAIGQSVFEVYPFVIVSTDFIKSDRRRHEFLRSCPELVIVDEAHGCAHPGAETGARHQRHRLIEGVSADPDRHLILVTATPHSGKEAAFRSLLTLLKPEFAHLPEDLTGKANEAHRRRLADHFIQRKRADIRTYLGADTVFPARIDGEAGYRLSPEYKSVFERAVKYARERIADAAGPGFRQRIRWWSALALLRALASSPAAAAATLRNRAAVADADTLAAADELGRKTVLDLLEDDASESLDLPPGCDDEDEPGEAHRRKLLKLARDVEKLKGKQDRKLGTALDLVRNLLDDGRRPIVFCRFVQTAEYVAEALRKKLGDGVSVMAVTGALPPPEREARVLALAGADRPVLVATDCLSEGINLQEGFDAVLHYDLSWNPTRHKQREGRVDRYGQPSPEVKAITYYGYDNGIDGIVLDVLIRKHQTIRNSLGVSVPVPVDTHQLVEAIFEGLLLKRSPGDDRQLLLPGFEPDVEKEKEGLFKMWEAAADREKRSRTLFAQRTIKVEAVTRELAAVRDAIGGGADVAAFVRQALTAGGAFVGGADPMTADLSDPAIPDALKEAVGGIGRFSARFAPPVRSGEILLHRTHPLVEGLAAHVLESAFDPEIPSPARRCGVIATRQAAKRTTLLLLRFRYHIITRTGETETTLLAEDSRIVGFRGAPEDAQWLDDAGIDPLTAAQPDANVSHDRAVHFLTRLMDGFDALWPHLEAVARDNGKTLLDAHRRVRTASAKKGVQYRVEPHLPPDVLGAYVYLPPRIEIRG